MRYLILLVVGLAAGFLLGRIASEPGRPRGVRERSETPPAVAARPARTPTEPAVERTTPEPAAVERRAPPPEVFEAGTGTLELDWTGAPVFGDLDLKGRSVRGEWEPVDFDVVEGGVTRLDLTAGVYVLTAQAAEDLSPREWRIALRASAVHRIALGAPATPDLFPIPQGLGRLDFEVFDLEGRPLRWVGLHVFGRGITREEQISEETSRQGRCRLHLRPGPYRVTLGARHLRVYLDAGETEELVFRYDGEGEVRYDREKLMANAILRALDRSGEEPSWAWGRDRLAYVRPGRYEVLLELGRDRPHPIGQLEVRAGESATIDYVPPGGIIAVEISFPASRPPRWKEPYPLLVTRLRDGYAFRFPLGISVPPWERMNSYTKYVRHVEPGRYRLRFEAANWTPAEAEVEVGDGEAHVALETRPR